MSKRKISRSISLSFSFPFAFSFLSDLFLFLLLLLFSSVSHSLNLSLSLALLLFASSNSLLLSDLFCFSSHSFYSPFPFLLLSFILFSSLPLPFFTFSHCARCASSFSRSAASSSRMFRFAFRRTFFACSSISRSERRVSNSKKEKKFQRKVTIFLNSFGETLNQVMFFHFLSPFSPSHAFSFSFSSTTFSSSFAFSFSFPYPFLSSLSVFGFLFHILSLYTFPSFFHFLSFTLFPLSFSLTCSSKFLFLSPFLFVFSFSSTFSFFSF